MGNFAGSETMEEADFCDLEYYCLKYLDLTHLDEDS